MLRKNPLPKGFDVAAIRSGFEGMAEAFPLAENVERSSVNAGGCRAEWITTADSNSERVVLYLHGGGYMVGSLNTHAALVTEIARACKARALNLDYRLAPEHPYPAAVDDAVNAYQWLLEQGIPAESIAIAGDSAGGGLAIATLMVLRDAQVPLPAAGVCLSPWLDLAFQGESMTTKASIDPLVQQEGLEFMAAAYLKEQDPMSPLASPLFGELEGLPPILIQVGTSEILEDDSTRFAAKARASGVDLTLETWEEMIHVWQLFAFLLPEGKQAIQAIGQYVLKRIR